MKLALAAALAITFLPACLENDEELTIRPDGSCSVRLVVKGQAPDFADGYPLPLDPAWSVTQADEPHYLDWVRAGLGSEELRARLARGAKKDLEFELSANFASVQDLPHSFAPERDPYRTAYLARANELAVERHGAKTVYRFERRFGAREFARFDAWSWMKPELPKELAAKLDRGTPDPTRAKEAPLLSDAELAQVVRAGAAGLRQAALAHLRDALAAVYTLGDASLAAEARDRIDARLDAALARVIAEERLRAILALLTTNSLERHMAREEAEQDGGARLNALESEIRATLRDGTREALAAEGVALPTRNAILAQLEWSLTAQDQTGDLSDEIFELTLHLPGRIVGGNYRELAGGAAHWKFEGKELEDREIVLRAVSVVE